MGTALHEAGWAEDDYHGLSLGRLKRAPGRDSG